MTPRVEVKLIDIDAISPIFERIETTFLDVDSEDNRTIVGSSAATNLREQLPIVSTLRTNECVLQKVDLIDLTDD